MKQTQELNNSAVMRGINKVGNLVRLTLGPFGQDVSINGEVTNDGITIARSIRLEDHEMSGVKLMVDAAIATDNKVHDATTTTMVLTQELANSFDNLKKNGMSVRQIRQDALTALEVIKGKLDESAIPCDTLDSLIKVANISVGDQKIAKIIAETTLAVGKSGLVSMAESKTGETYAEVFKGMKIERGFVAPEMCTNREKLQAVYENIHVLVADQNITDFNDLLPVLGELSVKGIKKIMIVCDDLTGTALLDTLSNISRKAFEILVVRGPIGTQRKGGMQDIAIAVGAKLFSPDSNFNLASAEVKDLGFAEKVVASKNETIIINGAGSKKNIASRAKEIETEISLSNSDYEKERMTERVARLTGGVGIIYVGDHTDSAQTRLRRKIEDAIGTTGNAFKTGVVAGSGYGLRAAAVNLIDEPKVFTAIKAATWTCISELLKSSGLTDQEYQNVLFKMHTAKKYYNIVTGNYYNNPLKEGIIDPVASVKEAITNAITSALVAINLGATIVDHFEEEN